MKTTKRLLRISGHLMYRSLGCVIKVLMQLRNKLIAFIGKYKILDYTLLFNASQIDKPRDILSINDCCVYLKLPTQVIEFLIFTDNIPVTHSAKITFLNYHDLMRANEKIWCMSKIKLCFTSYYFLISKYLFRWKP